MGDNSSLPELKEIVGALIFGANRPLSIKEMRKCLVEVADARGGDAASFAKVRTADVEKAVNDLQEDLKNAKVGFHLVEVAGGYKVQTDVACGKWLRYLLNARTSRLSRPALETLAIIAYRQPATKADIESVRGVNVDHLIRSLLEMQLVRITGRSDLPGRPFLYGTTHVFFEHFGLKNVEELNQIEPLLQLRRRAGLDPEKIKDLSSDNPEPELNLSEKEGGVEGPVEDEVFEKDSSLPGAEDNEKREE